MLSWLAPFVVAAVVAVLYFVLAAGAGQQKQAAMRHDINFYFILIVVTAIVSIIGGLRLGTDWLDTAAWVVAAIAVIAAFIRFRSSAAAPTADKDQGPL